MNYILLLAFLLFALKRLMTYLHIYQQEEYQPIRFLRWTVSTGSFDKRASIAILLFGLLGRQQAIGLSQELSMGFVVCALLAIAYFENDPRAASKKKLVMTGRAGRIYWTAFSIVVGIGALFTFASVPPLALVVPVQLLPVTLMLANLLLTPYERHVQAGFWNEAHQKLLTLKPTIIGITGSYGKTSTKHLLGHILEMQAPTLITPGSVNTPMGIARIVRERLGSHHRFFVCEMGAYGPGSIARLCRLAPPDVAVLTAIGMAHYERFKSLETVAKAKLELAKSVASRQGAVVLHEQTLELEDVRIFQRRYAEKTITVGSSEESTFFLREQEQTSTGLQAMILWKEKEYTIRAPLFGEHHIGNMAVAFATACTLGIAPEDAITALASVPQISHRLEVKTGINGSKLIDDAYNSNPVGFASGLRLLNGLRMTGGRRILITPGMVELGSAHAEEHRKIGVLAAKYVDVLIPVLPERIQTMIDGFSRAHPEGTIVPCSNLAAAHSWMVNNLTPNDVVLMENDLPDLYEAALRL